MNISAQSETKSRKKFSMWPRRLRWRIMLTLGILLIVIAAGTAIWGYSALQRPLPQTEGEIRLPGLTDPVMVYRDEHGVPHIEAQNELDLYRAQGFVTAQDRMFQMDLSRRQASGRLSEVVGEATVERDAFFRTIGLRRAAEASLSQYPERTLRILEAYAEGVNAYIEQAREKGTLPVEFRLLGYEPEPWSSVDSLTIGKYMAYDLSDHWREQAFHYYLMQKFSKEKALELFPSYPENGATVIQAMSEIDLDLSGLARAARYAPPEWNGSNNWVVSGEKTASGAPYLANDPHLGLGTPAIWYEVHLKAGDLDVNGVVFAGIPGIVVGRNQHIAWGVTNVGPDVQDLYIEKRHADDPYLFEYQGEWEKAEVIREQIKVKDGEPVEYEIVITRHGSVISDFALPGKEGDQEEPTAYRGEGAPALAMKWTAHAPSTELEAVLRFNRATNWEEFKEALTYFHTPAQNFVFASTDGTIAYRANGLIPVRQNGDGLLPVPGWSGEYEWEGFIPWDELPTIVNPDEGFISTANNKIVGDDYPYHITSTWAQPYRQNRIREVLNSKDIFTIEDMMKLQFDQKNLQAQEFLPIFFEQLEGMELSEMQREALQLLQAWDFADRPDEGAPLVFHLWMAAISDVLFADQIDDEMMPLFKGKAQAVDQLIRRAYDGNPGLWMEENGGLQQVVYKSFAAATDRASQLQGEKPQKWRWGKFHSVLFEHPLAAVKPLNLLFNPPSPGMGGSKITVAAAGWDTESGYVDHGAVWRGITDLSDMQKNWNVVGPGQSGHAASPWYDDQVTDWVTGGYHLTRVNPDAYQNTKHVLQLVPDK